MASSFEVEHALDAAREPVLERIREMTDGRGADAVILAAAGSNAIQGALDAARPGGRVMLFAQTVREQAAFDPASICVDEKTLLGSYSASVDLQEESVKFVFRGEAPLERLITHRFPLEQAVEALRLAAHPQPDSMKVVIQPGIAWEGKR